MDVDAAVLRKRLGLAEDADDAAINAALNTEPTPVEASRPAAPAVPEGMVLVEQETWEETREGARQGANVAARLALADRDQVITAAIREHRISGGSRERWERKWKADEVEARHLLTADEKDGGLAKGVIPGPEIGATGDGDGDPQSIEAEHQAVMARYFPNEMAKRNKRTRVRQEA